MAAEFTVIRNAAGRRSRKSEAIPRFDRKEKVWVHLEASTEKELNTALSDYRIHELTIEDILSRANRIKVEKFKGYLFFSFRGYHFEDGHLYSKNFFFIMTGKTIISISTEPRDNVRRLLKKREMALELLNRGPEFIFHYILDVETDHTLAIVHQIDEISDEYEEQMLMYDVEVKIARVFELRSSLQQIKKTVLMHKEILDELRDSHPNFFTGESAAFFRDVRDHSIKILDTVESIIDSISSAIEAYITINTRRTNDIMRILTIMTAIMLPMTLISGIYGMNFDSIPFLHSEYGFLISIVLMSVIGAGLLFYFKKKRWF